MGQSGICRKTCLKLILADFACRFIRLRRQDGPALRRPSGNTPITTGRARVNIDKDDPRPDFMEDGLLESVIKRGPIYRPTPDGM